MTFWHKNEQCVVLNPDYFWCGDNCHSNAFPKELLLGNRFMCPSTLMRFMDGGHHSLEQCAGSAPLQEVVEVCQRLAAEQLWAGLFGRRSWVFDVAYGSPCAFGVQISDETEYVDAHQLALFNPHTSSVLTNPFNFLVYLRFAQIQLYRASCIHITSQFTHHSTRNNTHTATHPGWSVFPGSPGGGCQSMSKHL